MSLNQFNNLYVNGCSLTAGGGLNEPPVIKKYKELHNIEWKDLSNILYPKLLSEKFGFKYYTNDAKSGSGIGRLVRTTYEYIKKVGIHSARNTIFILQINDSFNRVEYYSNKLGDYLIINPQWNDNKTLKSISVTDGCYHNEKKIKDYFFEEETQYFNDFIRKYHDPIVYSEKCYFDLLGLFTFLDKSKIEFFFMIDINFFQDGFSHLHEDFLNRKLMIDGHQSINSFCNENNLTIADDLIDWSDRHPGYFCHKVLTKKLYETINEKLNK